jgi:hypothetical protein
LSWVLSPQKDRWRCQWQAQRKSELCCIRRVYLFQRFNLCNKCFD